MTQPFPDPPPLPVVPMPVDAMYPGYPARSARPGVIGFIGITSIILGSLAILAGVAFGFMNFAFVIAGSAAKTLAVKTPPVTSSLVGVTTGGSAERLPADGLTADDRQNVADALVRRRALSPGQLLQLDELLAEHGKAIVPMASSLTPQQLAATVSSTRHLAYAGTAGSDEFVFGGGRMEVSEDHAVFFPTDGEPPLRSKAIQLPVNPFGSSTTGLQPQQIRSILRTINMLNGANVKSAQASALVQTFQSPGQQVIVPTTDGSDPAWEIDSATTNVAGALNIGCHNGTNFTAICCFADGTIGLSTASGNARVIPKINVHAATAALALTGVQFLLAIYLLIAGILTLRLSPRGAILHWIYVGVKIPIAIAMAVVSVGVWTSLMSSMPATPGSNPAAQLAGGLMVGVGPVAVGCIYPIVLVFVLLSGSARRFYAIPIVR